MAYKAMKLPTAPVQLSPPAANQIVNFSTYAKFSDPLNRVWVTARFTDLGINIAATTVATPIALRIDAGTPDADPRTCTYRLTQTPSGYQADTSQAACNITYRRSSGQGTYPLQAQITWKVVWNATATPDAPPQQPPLPDGMSVYTENVTVKEIQTVVR